MTTSTTAAKSDLSGHMRQLGRSTIPTQRQRSRKSLLEPHSVAVVPNRAYISQPPPSSLNPHVPQIGMNVEAAQGDAANRLSLDRPLGRKVRGQFTEEVGPRKGFDPVPPVGKHHTRLRIGTIAVPSCAITG